MYLSAPVPHLVPDALTMPGVGVEEEGMRECAREHQARGRALKADGALVEDWAFLHRD